MFLQNERVGHFLQLVAMRIISGTAKGRRISVPNTDDVRPTTDRVREALFSHLGNRVVGANVLDLFAGSGALGLESLSRGAASAVFVERSRAIYSALQKNLIGLGLHKNAQLLCMDGIGYLKKNGEKLKKSETLFDLIFLDPPYDGPLLDAALDSIGALGILSAHGLIVAEHRAGALREQIKLHQELQIIRTKQYGKTTITTIGCQ